MYRSVFRGVISWATWEICSHYSICPRPHDGQVHKAMTTLCRKMDRFMGTSRYKPYEDVSAVDTVLALWGLDCDCNDGVLSCCVCVDASWHAFFYLLRSDGTPSPYSGRSGAYWRILLRLLRAFGCQPPTCCFPALRCHD